MISATNKGLPNFDAENNLNCFFPKNKRLVLMQDCLQRKYLGYRIAFMKVSLNTFTCSTNHEQLFRDQALWKAWSKVHLDCLHGVGD